MSLRMQLLVWAGIALATILLLPVCLSVRLREVKECCSGEDCRVCITHTKGESHRLIATAACFVVSRKPVRHADVRLRLSCRSLGNLGRNAVAAHQQRSDILH